MSPESEPASQTQSLPDASYERLQSWSIADETRRMPHGVPSCSIQYLQSAAVAYHSSAVIYFCTMTASLDTTASHARSWGWGRDGDAMPMLTKQTAVMQCYAALCDIPDGMPSESALVLPLFVMGCESEFSEQQTYAIGRLRRLETTVGLGNIRRARMVVEQVRDTTTHRRTSSFGVTAEGPLWNRETDRLGWDLIVT